MSFFIDIVKSLIKQYTNQKTISESHDCMVLYAAITPIDLNNHNVINLISIF